MEYIVWQYIKNLIRLLSWVKYTILFHISGGKSQTLFIFLVSNVNIKNQILKPNGLHKYTSIHYISIKI